MNKKVVFMGSPAFSLFSLEALIKKFNVVGIVTQPDRPAGRGKKLKSPPVKLIAERENIPLIQPLRLKEDGVIDQLMAWEPDFIVVVAFGQILRSNVLSLPEFGCINVHASLLPKWRGAAPIQAAIYHGDEVTGVTIMKMDSGIDTGPIIAQKSLRILQNETAESLSKKLSKLGSELLIDTLPGYLNGKLVSIAQNSITESYAPMIKKEDGKLDLKRTAKELVQQIRAYLPWPGCYIEIGSDRLKIIEAETVNGLKIDCCELEIYEKFPIIGTSNGGLLLRTVQPAGKRPMSGDLFLRGFRDWKTQKITED